MNINKVEKRDTAADIIRIVAVFTVISVHFFLNTNFYSEIVTGNQMFIMCVVRTFFGVCVPLFIILTGYLMSHKTLSRKYYFGISKTLLIYLLASIACMIYKSVHLNVDFTLKSSIFEILSFTGAPYAWYIEMYIGLFLLIPFLNLIYNNLNSQKNKQLLVLTLVILTIVPTIFNIYNFNNAAWWANPASSTEYSPLIPDWWMSIYPITYYFIGCYLREYGLKLKTKTLLLLLVLCTLAFGAFNFYRSHGVKYITGTYGYWYGFQPCILSVLLFTILSRIKGTKIPVMGRFLLWKISDLALSMYLVSYIFDSYFYTKLKQSVPLMKDQFIYILVMVPLVFVCSMLLSAILELISKLIFVAIPKLKEIFISIKNDEGINLQTLTFVFLLLGLVIFAFWKCSYGFGGNDEAFYLTTAHRLSLGDIFIKDEWNLAQLSGFLMLPFVYLYRVIFGSTEGIILAARFLYVIIHAGVSIFIYRKLKSFGYISIFASALYFIFTPYDIMALSYNTMALELLVLTGLLMATSNSEKKLPFIISGLTFAGAVLCCPYLVAVYLIYVICVIVHNILVKRNHTKTVFAEDIFSTKTFIWFTCGVGILAIIFLIYIFTHIGISDILANLPGMFSDPQHPPIAFTQKVSLFFTSIYNCHPYFFIALVTYGIMLLVMFVDSNRRNHRAFYFICSCSITLYSYILFAPELTYKYYNALIFPMIFIGLTSYILCEKKPKKLFASIFILGILYAFCASYASNQYFYIISMATAITNISSLIFAGILLNEMKERHDNVAYGKVLKSVSFVALAFIIALLGGLQIKVKANHCFWETGTPNTLTSEIQNGPAKGIYTNPVNASTYENIYADLQYYKGKKLDNILILSEKTWCYLNLNDFQYGTFSAWLPEVATNLTRLETYYSLNPEKVPVYIYIPKDSKWDFASIISVAQSKGYTLEENNVSYKLTRQK